MHKKFLLAYCICLVLSLNFGKNLLTTHDGRKPNHINP
jgi:hypothetical protein